MKTYFLFFIFLCTPQLLYLQRAEELSRLTDVHARQAVAVDREHIYVIDNSKIIKRTKTDFIKVSEWKDTVGVIPHLNSGFISRDTLFCASSNYPKTPMVSSIEFFDLKTLKHIGSHSFGIYKGSCTWVVRHKGSWWAFFAHYENKAQSEDKGVAWSSLVRFTTDWLPVSSWVLPQRLIEKLRPYSLSGGIFIDYNKLMVTGHHDPFVYILQIPKAGSELVWLEEIKVPIKGQGIATDTDKKNVFWGIDRGLREVVQFSIK